MFQQVTSSKYAGHRSFYGNIQYAAVPKLLRMYGAWPEERPVQSGMLVSDWQEPLQIPSYNEEIDSRIAIIKQLKADIDAQEDLKLKNMLREQMRIERTAKERAFKFKAMIDEEEATFILLN